MTYLPPDQSPADHDTKAPSWEVLTAPRQQTIERIDRTSACDLLIVGGGIAGAALARLASFNGLRTILLEKNDYAAATSSRSSKMAHGGLRYLEMLDFKQVLEGVRAREHLFATAPHIVKPQQFLIPISTDRPLSRPKYSIGLTLYDLLARPPKERRHRWIPAGKLSNSVFGPAASRFSGAFSFFDGIMDDSRLVVENILAARQEGALCLNYAEVVSFEVRRDNSVIVSWKDTRSGTSHKVKTGIIVNCAGPWAPSIGRITPSTDIGKVQYSRGIHLLFSKKWDSPAVLLQRPEKGRVYFIWPHSAGTMVGTTEADVPQPSLDPIPTPAEVNELLEALKRDLPEAGLTRESLHYGFAGIRTLPLRSSNGSGPSAVSRRHRWVHTPGMLSLIGGKFTSAEWTAREGLAKVYELSEIVSPLVSIEGRKLPGAGGLEESAAAFKDDAAKAGVPPELAERAISRFGSGVRHFEMLSNPLQVVGGIMLRGEIELALRVEQAEGLEDLLRRRLGIEYCKGSGLEALEAVAEVVQSIRPEFDAPGEISKYRDRLARVHSALFSTDGAA